MLSQSEVLELLGPVLMRRGKSYIKFKRVWAVQWHMFLLSELLGFPFIAIKPNEYILFQGLLSSLGVFLRPAVPGEKIETILDGKVETKNVAKEGDMIVRADTSFKEQYILKAEDFQKNYYANKPLEIEDHEDAAELRALGFKAFVPNRRVLAIEVDNDVASCFPDGKFEASWGEPMIVELGDYLASGRTLDDGTVAEIIRIQKTVFHETYAPE